MGSALASARASWFPERKIVYKAIDFSERQQIVGNCLLTCSDAEGRTKAVLTETLNRRKTMATVDLTKKIGTWDVLTMNVKPRLPELPQLEPTVKELDAVIFEGRELQGLQEIHRKQLRETTQRSKDLVRRGRSSRNKLVAGLQSAYGVESLELLGFGVPPRLPKRRTRLTKAQKEEKARLEALEKAAAEAGLKV